MGIHPDCCTDRLRSPDVRRRAARTLFRRVPQGAIDGRPPPLRHQARQSEAPLRAGRRYTSRTSNRLGAPLFTYPDIDPVAISIGPLFGLGPIQVRWYGIMYLVGFTLGWWGARQRAKRLGGAILPEHLDDIVFYVALGAIVGGRIGYMLIYGTSELIADPLALFKVWQGGMSFHGGFIGVLVAMWLYARHIGQPFFVVMDFIAPWTAFGLFAGRIGNFINGELWGKPTSPDAPWAVFVDGVPRHASMLYEAFLEGIVLFLVLWTFSRKPRPTMATSALFLIVYGMSRFAVEFVRMPDPQIGYLAFGWVTMGQVLSAPMIVAGVILLVLAYRRDSKA
jgi:phosphatidylglycerol:prolipoprotein diacylglycerol transferase